MMWKTEILNSMNYLNSKVYFISITLILYLILKQSDWINVRCNHRWGSNQDYQGNWPTDTQTQPEMPHRDDKDIKDSNPVLKNFTRPRVFCINYFYLFYIEYLLFFQTYFCHSFNFCLQLISPFLWAVEWKSGSSSFKTFRP